MSSVCLLSAVSRFSLLAPVRNTTTCCGSTQRTSAPQAKLRPSTVRMVAFPTTRHSPLSCSCQRAGRVLCSPWISLHTAPPRQHPHHAIRHPQRSAPSPPARQLRRQRHTQQQQRACIGPLCIVGCRRLEGTRGRGGCVPKGGWQGGGATRHARWPAAAAAIITGSGSSCCCGL